MMRFSTPAACGSLLLTAMACAGPGTDADDWAGKVLELPLDKPAFVLTGTGGEAYDFQARTAGYVTLLFFGLHLLPRHLPGAHDEPGRGPAQASIWRSRGRSASSSSPSIPSGTPPSGCASGWGRIHSEFVGLRGSPEAIAEIERTLLLPPSLVDPERGGDAEYLVGHAAQVLAFGTDDVARIAYPWGIRQRDWLRDLPRLVAGEVPAPGKGRGE